MKQFKYNILNVNISMNNIRDIESVIDNLEKQFNLIKNVVKNTRRILHKLTKDEDLP